MIDDISAYSTLKVQAVKGPGDGDTGGMRTFRGTSGLDTPVSTALMTRWDSVPVSSTQPPSKPAIYEVASRASKPMDESMALRTRCKQLAMSVFLEEKPTTRSLGFTSAIAGEGKTLLARITAEAMAEDNPAPIVLMECNWENPELGAAYHLPSGPGLAEWLQDGCSLEEIRYRVSSNLTVIPAGDGKHHSAALLRKLQQLSVYNILMHPDELLIVDLPSVVTTSYGPFSAHLVDALVLVVRMGVTPDAFIAEAQSHLHGLPVHGIVFNRVASRLPRWLQQLL